MRRKGTETEKRAVTPPGQVIGLKAPAIVMRPVFRGPEMESWDARVESARKLTYDERGAAQ